ncbi:MAG TPA: hypothetical protein VKG05_00970 [Steroidobacteraceae bacterium]|nr:hypothetical protein [Steroidobacteraceae bacterium]
MRQVPMMAKVAPCAAILGAYLAMSMTPASAAALAPGDYQPGQGGASAAVSNRQARLTVPRFRVTATLGAQQAAAHHAFLTVNTEWRNVGPVQYLVPQLNNHLFLLLDGDRQVTLSDASGSAPHPLTIDQLLVPTTGSAVTGDVVFEIPDHGVNHLELIFIDSDQGDMRLLLYGHAPPAPPAIAGPTSNGLIEAAILGTRELAAVGSVHAPAGHIFEVIDIDLRALSPGNLVRFDPTIYSVLRDSDGYSYRAVSIDGLDDEFTAATQLIPLIPSRGTLAYLIPASHSALALAIDLPDYKAMTFALPNSGPIATRVGKPLVSFEDPDTLTLNVLGLSRVASVGKTFAAAGKDYLILDLFFASKVDQGIEFQTAEQLLLLDGKDEIGVDADALEALPHGMAENSVITAHGQARYQVAYQVPKSAAHFTLRYRGFQSDTRKPLPDVAAQGHGG